MKALALIGLLHINSLFAQITDGKNIFKEINPQDSAGIEVCNKANMFFDNFQFQPALELFTTCFTADSTNLNALAMIASCNIKLGRLIAAEDNYKLILLKDSLNIPTLNQLGSLYGSNHDYPGALKQYKKLILMDAENGYYHKIAGQYYFRLDENDSAYLYYKKSLKLDNQDITVYQELSELLFRAHEYSSADSLISLGLVLDPQNIRLLTTRAKAKYYDDKYQEAIKIADEIFAIQGSLTPALLTIRGVSQFHLEHFQEAIDDLLPVIEANPEAERIFYYLGLAYRQQKEFVLSAFYLQLAIKTGTNESLAIYYANLGLTFEKIENFEGSIKAYQKAYKDSKDKILLFHLARNYDQYYLDKKTAVNYYLLYINSGDTTNGALINYSRSRIEILKEAMHAADTLK